MAVSDSLCEELGRVFWLVVRHRIVRLGQSYGYLVIHHRDVYLCTHRLAHVRLRGLE